MMPLTMVRSGETATVKTVHGGHAVISRLSALGLTPGTRIQIVSAHGHGPVVVKIRDNRLALGHGMAHHVMVE